MYRLANLCTLNKVLFLLGIPYLLFYRFMVEWVLGVEIPWRARIGKELAVHHGQALVVSPGTVIGNNCSVRQSTTIGGKGFDRSNHTGSPIIGNNVHIGSNVCILGPIQIGNNVQIASGSVVIRDIPDNCTVVGNPGRIIYKK
ncbi:serine acetyltransferase [Maribacter sp. SA7]|uniref:serine O-acetyltransferase n=1 Tax=Maribacter zhoushanensis TaxID=3030012 RepID=UPI0023EAB0FB|nr:serine acetyltransferase [Maribacter zhoushanensis]MDF4201839.1 serine acetyltransferase [Maribacter zhoushanensis]